MKHNVVAPSVGESITEVSILKWAKPNGAHVKPGEVLLEIESDKATVEVAAEVSGQLGILKQAGEKIAIGAVVATIDDAVQAEASAPGPAHTKAPPPHPAAAEAMAGKPTAKTSTPAPVVALAPTMTMTGGSVAPALSPSARKAMRASGMDPNVQQSTPPVRQAPSTSPAVSPSPSHSPSPAARTTTDRPGDRRVPMTRIRTKIAERLVHAQRTAAILTTFNECDMKAVMDLRTKHKEAFQKKHGVSLSFMSFFTRAVVEGLKLIPAVNAAIDGEDVIYHDYQDVGVAVGTERGLVVPVIRDAGNMGFVDLEKQLGALAGKARDGKLSIADMTGGTFTISNGGTYGSLLSTPILNPPQSGILGMHKIQERPIAVNGQVVVRPMMYLALSYDHRLIDGKEAVTFLIAVKDHIENPEKLKLDFL